MWVRPRGRTALATALTVCRKAADVTQEALAARLGVNRTTVLNMEAGRNPALTRWADAMSLLGYDVVVVPRGAKVTVTEPCPVDDQAGDAGTAHASEATR
jgi:DNA-binding XRE family transcriptional regulator